MDVSFDPDINITGGLFSTFAAMERESKYPHFDILETQYDYVIKLFHKASEVRALTSDWVNDSKVIQISWKESVEEKEKKVQLLNDIILGIETRSASFSRTFRLPENADVDAMTTTVENGVLIVTIPKRRARAVVDRRPPQSTALGNQPPQHHVIEILG